MKAEQKHGWECLQGDCLSSWHESLSGNWDSLETEELVWSSSGRRQNHTWLFLDLEPPVPPMFHVRDWGTECGSLHSASLHLWSGKLSETALRFFCLKSFKDFAKISYFLSITWKQSVVRVNKINARKWAGIIVGNAENEITSVLAQ